MWIIMRTAALRVTIQSIKRSPDSCYSKIGVSSLIVGCILSTMKMEISEGSDDFCLRPCSKCASQPVSSTLVGVPCASEIQPARPPGLYSQ
ncbi:hypothetical protein R1flu_028478 [Riccia fluitans]|uniref:NADH-plastoquinone oxidoreductase subunit K n=1 Tax=Riccia fluitans TaxID=41844 RepID=A0ABD1XLT3_9MARC